MAATQPDALPYKALPILKEPRRRISTTSLTGSLIITREASFLVGILSHGCNAARRLALQGAPDIKRAET